MPNGTQAHVEFAAHFSSLLSRRWQTASRVSQKSEPLYCLREWMHFLKAGGRRGERSARVGRLFSVDMRKGDERSIDSHRRRISITETSRGWVTFGSRKRTGKVLASSVINPKPTEFRSVFLGTPVSGPILRREGKHFQFSSSTPFIPRTARSYHTLLTDRLFLGTSP